MVPVGIGHRTREMKGGAVGVAIVVWCQWASGVAPVVRCQWALGVAPVGWIMGGGDGGRIRWYDPPADRRVGHRSSKIDPRMFQEGRVCGEAMSMRPR